MRALVLTRAYQLGADATEAHRAADPANRLVWRHAPRRLDAEEIRDAMLAAAGTLDPKRPDGSPAKELRMVEMRDNGPEAAADPRARPTRARTAASTCRCCAASRRSALEAFDPVDQTLVTGTPRHHHGARRRRCSC